MSTYLCNVPTVHQHRHRFFYIVLAALLVLGFPSLAQADLCGDTVEVRFARFPNSVSTTVACPDVDLPCAGTALGLIGGCRFSIDIESQSIRISDFSKADYGVGATLTFSDLDSLLCDGTVPGALADVQINFMNAAGFVPEIQFTQDSVQVSLAKEVTRWAPGDFIELQLDFEADCPVENISSLRSGWVPNVGSLQAGELPLGDLYTFQCPEGGTVSVAIDTKDDLDVGESHLDPVLEIYDAGGNLVAIGDDEEECTYPPVCGFGCPSAQDVECGAGGLFSLVVRDFGTANKSAEHCREGGGYELALKTLSTPGLADLGGGAPRELPAWLTQQGFPTQAPGLDDENVPTSVPGFFEGLTQVLEGSQGLIQKIEEYQESAF